MEYVVNALSGGREKWFSDAAGPVFAMPGHDNLASSDFKGTCLAVFVNAAAGPLNGGFYLIFMGKQESMTAFIAWVVAALSIPAVGAGMMASSIVGNSHAVAVVPAKSLGAGASIGVSLNFWAGRIS